MTVKTVGTGKTQGFRFTTPIKVIRKKVFGSNSRGKSRLNRGRFLFCMFYLLTSEREGRGRKKSGESIN